MGKIQSYPNPHQPLNCVTPINDSDLKYGRIAVWKKVDEDWLDEHHVDYITDLLPEANKFILTHPKRFHRVRRV